MVFNLILCGGHPGAATIWAMAINQSKQYTGTSNQWHVSCMPLITSIYIISTFSTTSMQVSFMDNSAYLHTEYYRIPWKFRGRKASRFSYIRKTFLYENLKWHCLNMDLREGMWDSAKVFSLRSVCTTFCETFLPQNFHGIWYATVLLQSSKGYSPADVKSYKTLYLLIVQVYRLPLHCFAFTTDISLQVEHDCSCYQLQIVSLFG